MHSVPIRNDACHSQCHFLLYFPFTVLSFIHQELFFHDASIGNFSHCTLPFAMLAFIHKLIYIFTMLPFTMLYKVTAHIY